MRHLENNAFPTRCVKVWYRSRITCVVAIATVASLLNSVLVYSASSTVDFHRKQIIPEDAKYLPLVRRTEGLQFHYISFQ